MAEWTPELKEEVIAEYVKANPTPETSSEIIAEIVEAHKDSGLTINGVRMVLVKADVYVKIEEGKTPKKGNGTASKRINKADSINELVSLIKSQGIEPDTEIFGKFTGKAAVHVTDVINQLIERE